MDDFGAMNDFGAMDFQLCFLTQLKMTAAGQSEAVMDGHVNDSQATCMFCKREEGQASPLSSSAFSRGRLRPHQ